MKRREFRAYIRALSFLLSKKEGRRWLNRLKDMSKKEVFRKKELNTISEEQLPKRLRTTKLYTD